ncbi:tetraacyldisaccharide 4'-kinase [Flavobacterium subsaxonicum]|uniref:Tetraacyldisaccharide 4'-kinase n=1 Tax=Flavobacterium subsaxonicum WB 4.1-42 = DSM 21790 TaxID=1121898 RepID=A0A0A2MM98_9FLAO|nr:tetraacyldisaccharide 4'-kinase [Flavobacterium subsaxonicum]KGO93454.1 tetraacyldisaccharide 4'-kinase [Flavobacterium subsaxonicum WB 4.1-42 = DSM 21790]
MSFLRKLLLPFSIIYWLITALRNLLYNNGIFKSYAFPLPIIAIGNLSTGGTGKTPQTEYLIRLLADKYKIATLSRGYKRKSKGFVLAGSDSNADILGDEPYQFYSKFSTISVAVDADRKNGIEQLLSKTNPDVILLDDAYQHRRVKAGFYILLTAYGDIYADDYILPAGNLRESRSGAERAGAIIVTKCPPDLSIQAQNSIINKLKPQPGQKVYFTSIEYDSAVHNSTTSLMVSNIKTQEKILVAGIAKPQPFFNYLKGSNDTIKEYADHHDFTAAEIEELKTLAQSKIIVTTEKDYMRLEGKLPQDKLFYLPIKSRFLANADVFDATILEFVKTSF